ncbi:MAG TPA: ABC transporter transmembrane domain-containing protein, partial [Caulobacteraceae bacterium]|nr:ABC transporter transmembrane domain-containing protein [Caulobacteraceae bacterium]
MSDFAFDEGGMRDAGPPQRQRNASLGSAEAEEIFMAFDTRIVRRFAAFLKPHPWYLVGAVVAAIVSAGAQLVQPLMIGQAVTVATGGKGEVAASLFGLHLQRIDVVCLEFVASFIVFTITSLISQSMSTRLAQKVIFDLRRAMFDHFQTISLSYMDKTHVGRVMSRLQGDVNALQDFL